MNTLDTILSMHSIRHFKNEKLEWDVIEDILEYANKLHALYKGIAIEFKLVSNIEANQGFHGPFSVKAPYYLCISSEEKDYYRMNAGFMMQHINLYIASKGLGTCFTMGSPGLALKDTMKYDYVLALAFGKAATPVYREPSEAKRLTESELIVYKENVTPDVKQVLYAARLAPSSYNSQPWRFVVYRKRIHVFVKKNHLIAKILDFSKMIDIGIMLANLHVAADELWVDLALGESEAVRSKRFQNNEYVCTLTIA